MGLRRKEEVSYDDANQIDKEKIIRVNCSRSLSLVLFVVGNSAFIHCKKWFFLLLKKSKFKKIVLIKCIDSKEKLFYIEITQFAPYL